MHVFFISVCIENQFIGGTCWQSSTVYSAVCSKAVDGVLDPVYRRGSCTHTRVEDNPTWGVDLPLRWRHNEWDGVSNHQPQDRLLNRLSGRRSKKTSKPRVTGLCVGNSPGTGEFPAQMASNVETVSIWWRHHGWDTWMYPMLMSWIVKPSVQQVNENITIEINNTDKSSNFDSNSLNQIHTFIIPARLKDPLVLISSTGFPVNSSQFNTNQFHLCGQFPGVPPAGVKSRVKCPWGGITGRYVYITLPRTVTALTLCEVQIYRSKR